MLARLRVSLPDRPGTLGRVASALGAAGADIAQVEVLDAEAGRALDDVHVRVRDDEHLDRVAEALVAVPGVSVLGVQHPAPPTSGHAELELVARVLARPERGVQTLVDGAPAACGGDWAAVLEYPGHGTASRVVATSVACPGEDEVPLSWPLRLSTPSWTGVAGAALVPLEGSGLGLLVARVTGAAFHRSELWRLEQVGRIVGSVLTARTRPA